MHITPGRLRIVSDAIKAQGEAELRVNQLLMRLSGVLSVRTNPLTGSVTVTFDEHTVTAYTILNALIDAGATSNVIPFPTRRAGALKVDEAVKFEPILTTEQKKALVQIAKTAIKLALPFILQRYIGKSAAKAISQLV